MPYAGRFAFVLLGLSPLVGCASEEPMCGTETNAEGKEVSTCAGVESEPLCDGSSSLRFAATSGGGNVGGVPRVVQEVGWAFLLIDGECRYWTMTEPDEPIRTGTLDATQAADFSSAFRLGHWSANDTKTGGCFDAGSTSLRFGETRVTVSCVATDLTQAYSDWLATLYDAGTRASGDVRYTVTDASEEAWVVGNTTDIASAWPLTDAPSVLLERGEDENAEPAVASQDEAEALRAARDAYAAREASTGPWLRIPMALEVAGAAPQYFDVAMRDVTPFERDGELSLDDFFGE